MCQLVEIGVEIEEEAAMVVLLKSIPSKYNNIVLDNYSYNLQALESLISKPLEEEKRMNYVEEESSDQALFGGKKKKVIFKKQKTNKLNFGIIVENRDTLVGVVKSWLSLYSKEML